MWLVLMSLRLRGLLAGSWPCRVFLRTRPTVIRLRMAGVARVCGIWLGVAQWDMQAGVCACGRRLFIQTGSGWPFSVPRCAARPASAEADACWVWIDTQS